MLSDTLRLWSLLIMLLLLVMLFPVGPLKISTVQKANATALPVSLVGYASTGWIGADGAVNPTITIPHGELLNITTSSGDGKHHEFYVDVDGNGIRDYPVDPIADTAPSTTTLGYFAPGAYNYYDVNYPVTMHGTFIVLPPPGSNFAITPAWWLAVIVHGSQTSSTNITVSSVNGFSGIVTLSPPTPPAGITATLSKSTVSVSPSTPETTLLNLTAGPSTPEGRYNVTLTGSDGTGFQTASVTTLVFVADFQLSGTTNLPVPLGSSRNDTFQVISAWGFYGNITLSTTVSTPGLRAFLNTTHVSVTPFTFAHVLLTVDTAGVQFGDYNVTITATSSPSRSHQLVYHVSAWPESTAAPPGPAIDPQLLVWAGLLIFVVAIALSDILLRRRRRKELRETGNSTTENRSE
jgi:hypothetical protein